MTAGRALTIVLLFASAPTVVSAQPRALRASERVGSITIDGVLDDAPWASSEPATDFVHAEPREGATASERTEVRVVFDVNSLYIAAACFDREPSGIIANSLRPDFPPGDEDTLQVLLDTYADSRGGFLFVTNPKGAKRDVQVAAEGSLQNADWDAVWDVATRITSDGWFVEMRIPFATLRYASPLTKSWKVNFGRAIRRRNERTFWSPVPRRFDISRVSLAGELQGMTGQRLQTARNLWLKPYGTSRIDEGRSGARLTRDVGGDLKYAVTNGLTLDVTVNADFAHVEVDNQVINLDRFSLFFPEKREFFLENQGIFQIGTMDKPPNSIDPEDVAVFYSRRIGLSDRRNVVPILGGGRLTGRVGAFQIGVLNLETGEGDGQQKENHTALRVKRDLFARSEVGAFFLNRQGEARPDNRSYGVDLVLRPRNDLVLNLLHNRTDTPGLGSHNSLTRIEVDYNTPYLRLFGVLNDVGDDYRNDLGYVTLSGVEAWRMEATPRIRPSWRDGLIRELLPEYNIRYITDQHGTVLVKKITTETTMVFRDGAEAAVSYRRYYDHIETDFRIQDPIVIPQGSYEYDDLTLSWSTDRSRMFSANASWADGSFWNGTKSTVHVGARFRPNARLGAEVSVGRDDVKLKGGEFTAVVSRLRFGYSLSTRAFLDALLQHNNQDHRLGMNIRFNFIHRPLSDIFVVYTEDRPTPGFGEINRVLSLKYTHLLAF